MIFKEIFKNREATKELLDFFCLLRDIFHIDLSPKSDYNITWSVFGPDTLSGEIFTKNYIDLIDRQQKAQDSIYHKVAVKFGLSDTALWILYILSDGGEEHTQQELCRQCCFSKQTVNTAISKLVKDGFVTLEVLKTSRKQKKIILTESGRELADSTAVRLRQAEIKAYEKLSEEELKIYLDISSRLTRFLRVETEKL